MTLRRIRRLASVRRAGRARSFRRPATRTVLVALALGLAAAACDYVGDGATKVALLGDSVADDADAATVEVMQDRYSYQRFTIRAGAIEDQLLRAAALLAEDPPDVLIVELGIGDAQAWHDDARIRADVVRLLDAATVVPCVRWTNLKLAGVNPFYQGLVARADDVNRILAEELARYPNAELVDYDVWAQARPHHFLADGLHLNDAGRAAYAEWLASRVAGGCLRR